MRVRVFLVGVLAALVMPVCAGPTRAQATEGKNPTFDVASVKANQSGNGPPVVGLAPGGRLMAPNVTLRELIRTAYGFDDLQIVGGPGWIASERFAITAQTESTASADQIRAMLSALLTDRFRLSVHRESRELPAYALIADTRAGARVRRAGAECAPPAPPAGLPVPPPPPPPPPSGGFRPLAPVLSGRCATIVLPGYLSAREIAMSMLAARLSLLVGRAVMDRTGLTGMFDLDLRYAPDTQPAGSGPPNSLPLPPADAPSIFTAVHEQLGLRLDSIKTPMDVLVIDHAERPTPD